VLSRLARVSAKARKTRGARTQPVAQGPNSVGGA
jgi:hypothetical protein